MKVLIVATSDIGGGGHVAAYRLHKSLLSQNIDSKMLVQDKSSDYFTVISLAQTKIQKVLNLLRPTIDRLPLKFYKNRTKTLFSPSWLGFSNVVNKINEINPDIVHLHWVNGGMLRIEDIAKIKAPIVWNCQDMWPFTGGCHFDKECKKYQINCGSCPVLGSEKENDLSRKILNRKYKSFAKINKLTVVGVSGWIAKCAKNSTLFKDRNIINLPNCFDTKIFKAVDKDFVRSLFKIPRDKRVILFGAMNSLGDTRKGAKELFEAINLLTLKNTVFVIAGSSAPKEPLKLKYPTYFISPLLDEVSLPLMYSVADVMIVPSLEENLANSIIESLSCSVPVVAFDIGGNSDMINHKKNGYLAKKLNIKDLAIGIEWVLNNENYGELCKNARQKVLNEFDSEMVSEKYIKLYKGIVNDNE